MKRITLSSCLSVVFLLIGCASEEHDALNHSLPPTAPAEVLSGVNISLAASPPETSPAEVNAIPASEVAVPAEANAERRTELADYTEKVYLRWNAVLTDYRQKQKRWPGSLSELQQHEPELASLQPPRGFRLQLDQNAGEVYVTRATRRTQSGTPPPLYHAAPSPIR